MPRDWIDFIAAVGIGLAIVFIMGFAYMGMNSDDFGGVFQVFIRRLISIIQTRFFM